MVPEIAFPSVPFPANRAFPSVGVMGIFFSARKDTPWCTGAFFFPLRFLRRLLSFPPSFIFFLLFLLFFSGGSISHEPFFLEQEQASSVGKKMQCYWLWGRSLSKKKYSFYVIFYVILVQEFWVFLLLPVAYLLTDKLNRIDTYTRSSLQRTKKYTSYLYVIDQLQTGKRGFCVLGVTDLASSLFLSTN